MERPRQKVIGQLGKVLYESAQAAASYVRSHATELLAELDSDWFAKHDIQAEQAYGAVPAHTAPEEWRAPDWRSPPRWSRCLPAGELLPVGAFKEKALAAKRDYAQRVVPPAGNEHDAEGMPEVAFTRVAARYAGIYLLVRAFGIRDGWACE